MQREIINKTHFKELTQTYNESNEVDTTYNLELTNMTEIITSELILKNDKIQKYKISAILEGTIIESTSDVINYRLSHMNKKRIFIEESYQDYINIARPKGILVDRQWIENIYNKTSEQSDIYYENDDFILLPDLRWKDKIATNLYCLIIFKKKDLLSIRDLTNQDIKLLEESLEKSLEIINNKWNIDKNQIRSYFHYHPSTWQLHMHLTHYKSQYTTAVLDNSHTAHSVIQNLKIDGDYYKKITMQYLNI
jgi:hypothetical protein